MSLPRGCKFLTSFCQIAELRMCALSHRIREEPNWWEKLKDKTVVEKWREEALQQERANEIPLSKPTFSGEPTYQEALTLRELNWSRKLTSARKLTPTMVKFFRLRVIPPILTLVFRLITYSKSSTDMHICVIQRLG